MRERAARRNELVSRFLAGESGATAIEYAMVAGGIALAVVAAINSIGGILMPGYLAAGGAFN
jgi:pilus assembly protein Flp/PilA